MKTKLLGLCLAVAGLSACEGAIGPSGTNDGDARGSVESALASKEDPATTAMMRAKVKPLLTAITAKDAKAYQIALLGLLQDAEAQPTAERVKRFTSLEVLSAESPDGLQALVFRYGAELLAKPEALPVGVATAVRASVTFKKTQRGPLAAPCGQVVRQALHADFPAFDDLAGLACLGSDWVITRQTLSLSGVSLPVQTACGSPPPNNTVYQLDVPAPAAGVTITNIGIVGALPFSQTFDAVPEWSTLRAFYVGVDQFPEPLPFDAQTSAFLVRVSTTAGNVDYPVTIPVAVGIHHSCLATNTEVVNAGAAVDFVVAGNGERSARTWTTLPVPGKPGLPAGLSFAPGTGARAGQGVVSGTVATNALSGELDFRFTQAGVAAQTLRYRFEVKLRTTPAAIVGSYNLARGQSVWLPLPTVAGGTGTYSWTVSNLPPGLAVTSNGGVWAISGTVSATAGFELRPGLATVTSGTQTLALPVTFDLRKPFKVYSQNMILFPSDIVNPEVNCLPGLWAGLVGYLACEVALNAFEALVYDQGVHNTDADNEQRAGFMLDHVNAESYDAVALQEVWTAPVTEAQMGRIVNDASASYRASKGPGWDFEDGIHIGSGLLTLVKKGTALVGSPDVSTRFTEHGGGDDGLANKGFVSTQVFLSNDPNEYVWVVNTHTHAVEPATRALQFAQLQSYLAGLPTTHPVLLMGDLNVAAEEYPEYNAMRAAFPHFNDLAEGLGLVTASWATNAYDQNWFTNINNEGHDRRLDYVMLRTGSLYTLELVPNGLQRVVSQRQTALCNGWSLGPGVACHYSDHFGLAADLRFRKY